MKQQEPEDKAATPDPPRRPPDTERADEAVEPDEEIAREEWEEDDGEEGRETPGMQ